MLVSMGLLMFSLLGSSPAAAYSGVVGTTGSVHVPTQAVSDSPVSIQVTGLTLDQDYIVITNQGNITWTASNSRADFIRSYSEESTGVLSVDLYGYDSANDIQSGAILDSATIVQTPKEDIAPSALFTGFIGIIVTIGVVFLLFKAFGGTGNR